MEHRALLPQLMETRAHIERPHRDMLRHADMMRDATRYPESKVRRQHPKIFARGDLHDSRTRIDQLIGPVRMVRNHGSARIFTRQRRNGHAADWIVFGDDRLTHKY